MRNSSFRSHARNSTRPIRQRVSDVEVPFVQRRDAIAIFNQQRVRNRPKHRYGWSIHFARSRPVEHRHKPCGTRDVPVVRVRHHRQSGNIAVQQLKPYAHIGKRRQQNIVRTEQRRVGAQFLRRTRRRDEFHVRFLLQPHSRLQLQEQFDNRFRPFVVRRGLRAATLGYPERVDETQQQSQCVEQSGYTHRRMGCGAGIYDRPCRGIRRTRRPQLERQTVRPRIRQQIRRTQEPHLLYKGCRPMGQRQQDSARKT